MIQVDPRLKRNFPAMIGFLLAFAVGLRVVAAESSATAPAAKDPKCAYNQPELRKLFPIEMRILKFFEGTFKSKTYVIRVNATKTDIKMQMEGSIEGERTVTPVKAAHVCKDDNGDLVLKVEGKSIPITVLDNISSKWKVGENWMHFSRIDPVHRQFMPAIPADQSDSEKAASPESRPVVSESGSADKGTD